MTFVAIVGKKREWERESASLAGVLDAEERRLEFLAEGSAPRILELVDTMPETGCSSMASTTDRHNRLLNAIRMNEGAVGGIQAGY